MENEPGEGWWGLEQQQGQELRGRHRTLGMEDEETGMTGIALWVGGASQGGGKWAWLEGL